MAVRWVQASFAHRRLRVPEAAAVQPFAAAFGTEAVVVACLEVAERQGFGAAAAADVGAAFFRT